MSKGMSGKQWAMLGLVVMMLFGTGYRIGKDLANVESAHQAEARK